MDANPQYLWFLIPIAFPLLFAVIWIGVTSLLGWLSGWYQLAQQYPDRDERPLLQLNWQSGLMGPGVNLRGVLKIGVCNSGLRIGMLRAFGLFSHDFFVPWAHIQITRRDWMFSRMAILQFGHPPIGRLALYAGTADRLAQAALRQWPETGAHKG